MSNIINTRIEPTPARARRTIAQTLRLRGIACVEFDYAGEFGAGQWVSVQALHSDAGEYVLLSELDLYVWCAHQFAALLRTRYPDWNEHTGSCGMFTWDVLHDRILHTHFPCFDPRSAIRLTS